MVKDSIEPLGKGFGASESKGRVFHTLPFLCPAPYVDQTLARGGYRNIINSLNYI